MKDCASLLSTFLPQRGSLARIVMRRHHRSADLWQGRFFLLSGFLSRIPMTRCASALEPRERFKGISQGPVLCQGVCLTILARPGKMTSWSNRQHIPCHLALQLLIEGGQVPLIQNQCDDLIFQTTNRQVPIELILIPPGTLLIFRINLILKIQ